MKENEINNNKDEEKENEDLPIIEKNTLEDEQFFKEFEMLLDDIAEEDSSVINDELDEEAINIKKILFIYNLKDHLMMIFLLLSSSLNFSALYLPFIIIGISYIFLLLKQNNLRKEIKMKIEIICLIYSTLLLIAKSILIGLIRENKIDYDSHIELFSNLGIRYLNLNESDFKLMLNLFGEIFLIIISIISMIISCYYKKINFEDNNIEPLKEEEFKSKIKIVVYLGYFSILINAIYNKSFLTLAYLIFYQILLILISLKNNCFKFLKYISVVYFFFYSTQLILINIFNIHSFQEKFLKVNIIMKDDNIHVKKVYSIFTMIGINYSYYHDILSFLYELLSYLTNIFSIVIFTNIQILYSRKNQLNEKKEEKLSNKIEEEQKSTCNKIKSALKTFFTNMEFLWIIFRILSLIWIIQLKNFLSLGVFGFVFFSFLFENTKFIFNLFIFLLIPINLISLCCLHICNINGVSEDLSQNNEKIYNDFSYIKDDSNLYYILFGIYFIFIIIFLSIYNKKISEIKFPNENAIIINPDDNINKVINDEQEEPLINNNDEVNKDIEIKKDDESNKNKEVKNKKIPESNDLKFLDVLLKWFYSNVDKITLVAMYFISMHTINIIHFFFIVIFLIQILKPNFTKKYSKLIVVLIQILFLFEYIVSITNNYYESFFLENYELFEFLLSVSKTKEKYEINIYIEIWCYVAIYVFYLHDKLNILN